MEPSKPPRVFISYSWESEDHKRWVRYLGERLYAAGIEARLDQWFVQPGESFTAFMEQEVEAADFVLVVCTPSYARKSNKRQGGVGYEQQIVSGQLMSGTAHSKFIPILREGDYEPGPDCAIPTHFQGIAWIDFRNDLAFEGSLEDLIRVILSKPRFAPPPLGARPSLETITATVMNRGRLTKADESSELPDLNIEKGDSVKTALKEEDEAAIEVNNAAYSASDSETSNTAKSDRLDNVEDYGNRENAYNEETQLSQLDSPVSPKALQSSESGSSSPAPAPYNLDDKKSDNVKAGLEEAGDANADLDDTASSRRGFGAGNVVESGPLGNADDYSNRDSIYTSEQGRGQSDDSSQSKLAETEWNRTSHDSSDEDSTCVNTSPGNADDTVAKISDAVYPLPNFPASKPLKQFKQKIAISISIFLVIAVLSIVQWRKERDPGGFKSPVADHTGDTELKPDDANAYYNRGVDYSAKGDQDRAIADYNKAIELKPDYATAYYNRGRAYVAKGDDDRAIADYNRAIELKPDYADAYYNRGIVYAAKGDNGRAIADCNRAIELRPYDASAYVYRGIVYAAKGDKDGAIADYNKAIELKPDDALAYGGRGTAYLAKGDNDRAIADYSKAIELKPDDASAYYNRGRAYAAKGDNDRAIADFRKSHELFTAPRDRKNAMQQLRRLGAE